MHKQREQETTFEIQRQMLLIVLAIFCTMFMLTGSSLAITNGEPDGNDHPYVGLVVFYDGDKVPLLRCSGSLLSATLLLTAGHCTQDATYAQIWFDSGPIPLDIAYDGGSCNDGGPYKGYPCAGGYEGIPLTHPDFCFGCGKGILGTDTHDVGVIVLSSPVPDGVVSEYGELPEEGIVDTLPEMTGVELIGYGVKVKKGAGKPPSDRWVGPRERFFAPTQRIRSSEEFIMVTTGRGQDKGGICFGDSGGPNLLSGTNTILAISSLVLNANCAGNTYSNRIDTDVLDFIRSFLP